MTDPTCVALVPARAGSKRLAGKNVRALAGHPLMAYTLAAARESGVFGRIIVSTDSEDYADIARHYGADVPWLRPPEYAGDLSPDIEWVAFTIERLQAEGPPVSCFSILRPTSPFRQAQTIRRAWDQFKGDPTADSLRAVEKCRQHPGKMWIVRGRRMVPLLPFANLRQPWHSSQYQALPDVFVQNASLEMAWTRVVSETGTIAGDVVSPFFTDGYEGLDINRPDDWETAEALIRSGQARLPDVACGPYPGRAR